MESTANPPITIIDALASRARGMPGKAAFVFVDRRLEVVQQLTYFDLWAKVSGGAEWLQRRAESGDRVVIYFEPGLAPLLAFLSTLAAGMIAVPAARPSLGAVSSNAAKEGARRRLAASRNIISDCSPRVALASLEAVSALAEAEMFAAESILVHDVEALFAEQSPKAGPGHLDWFQRPAPEDIAFLQYTSGSTALPKGVVVTHANLVHNQKGISVFFGSNEDSVFVSWLPLFHDLGLVGGALQSIWSGGSCVQFSPVDFLRRPRLWMEAVAKFKGTITGGPNFAFQLASANAPDPDSPLDLSSLKACACGAEPIRHSAMQSFVRSHTRHGLREDVVMPCYGLAESTLIVSGIKADLPYRTVDPRITNSSSVLTSGNAEPVVSCGAVACSDASVSIADPDTGTTLQSGAVGEIHVRSRSVSPGYWCDLKDQKSRHFPDEPRLLRTGDLGFMGGGELFVCGRLKNTLIVHGRKFIAEDIEATLETELGCLERLRVAAFSLPALQGERVVIAIECLLRYGDQEAGIIEQTIQVVSSTCGFIPHEVCLFRPGTLPRTTSGKLQRRLCAEIWLRDNPLQIPDHE